MFLTFDFQCTKCSHIEERLVKKGNDNPDCSKCGHKTNKLLSPPAMVYTPFTGGRQKT